MSFARAGVLLVLLVALEAAVTIDAGAQAQPNVDELLSRVGEKIAEFYDRAQRVICLETSRVQPINLSYSPLGFTRTVESELRVEAEGGDIAGGAKVVREVRKVNGRVPRDKDRKSRDGCTDPNPWETEPLAFLLPAHRSDYQFTWAGFAKDRDRAAVRIDFESVNRKSNPELIEDKGGHDDCFDWSEPVATRGRIWVDAENYEVLQVERSLNRPVIVKVPIRIQRRHNLGASVMIIREDTTIRYQKVVFSDPDESLLVPESIHILSMLSGGLQSTRRSQVYSDYRRFVTGGRVVASEQ
jgi:hypothetical protein